MTTAGTLRAAAAVLVSAALAAATAGSAAAQEKVRWKLASSYASTLDIIGENIDRVIDNIDTMSNGNFKIHFYEPGALVPALEVFDSVAAGAVDMSYTTTGFHAGKFPGMVFFSSVPFGPAVNEYLAWIQFGGGKEIYDREYNKRGVQGFQCGVVVAESSGWFREEITSLDQLKGLKMRFFGLGARVMEKFGVSTQLLAGGDIYPALELGTIDATEFSYPRLDRKLGFYEIAKHYYFPGWHQQASLLELIVNLEKYRALPKAYQKMIEVACGDANMWLMAKGDATQGEALDFLKSKGVQIHKWTDDQIAAFRKAWEEVAEEAAEDDPLFREVYDSYKTFRASYSEWRELGYLK
jgi:TRAP-type mannitol/chloroaromatic compound transport system substrate-binding protein